MERGLQNGDDLGSQCAASNCYGLVFHHHHMLRCLGMLYLVVPLEIANTFLCLGMLHTTTPTSNTIHLPHLAHTLAVGVIVQVSSLNHCLVPLLW